MITKGRPSPRWQFQCGASDGSDGNSQWYTDSGENCHVRNGKLRIIARRERSNSCKYTSADCAQYGRLVVRPGGNAARLPPSKEVCGPLFGYYRRMKCTAAGPTRARSTSWATLAGRKRAHPLGLPFTRHNPTVGRQRSKAKLIPTPIENSTSTPSTGSRRASRFSWTTSSC